MRARLMTRAERWPLRINRSSWSRSSADNRTAYFSATMDAALPAPLFATSVATMARLALYLPMQI